MLDYTPKIGDYLTPDNWRCGETLQAGDNFSALRLPTCGGGPIKSLAVKVQISGRKVHWGAVRNSWVRVKITFLGDSEPDTVTHGRLYSPNF